MSPALLRPPPLQRRRPRVLCSLLEQGAGAPVAPEVLQRWGLDYDFQPVPPPSPTRPRRPIRWAPMAAPPAHKEDYSSATYSNNGYSITLLKTTYLLRRGLRDL
jgi:hypothetical protein